MTRRRLLKATLLVVLVAVIAFARSVRHDRNSRVGEQVDELLEHRWVCYAPTNYDPREGKLPSIGSIRSDLTLMKRTGFDGVITYECNGPLAAIPEISDSLGLKVILGIWAPGDKEELEMAAALEDLVSAYCVGNEGLGTRYDLRVLDQGLLYLLEQTSRPVTISEQIHLYNEVPALLTMGDWLFPIVHPHFAGIESVDVALAWCQEKTDELMRQADGTGEKRKLLAKEIGMPSAGQGGYSEIRQAEFLEKVFVRGNLRFAVFEAFDREGWEDVSAVEPYWGIFRADRSPKASATRLQALLK